MINRVALLSDLQKLLQRLEGDLLERSESTDVPEVGKTLRAEYDRAKTAERTAQNYEDWRTDAITQAAAAWVLSCVFVRFLEDNRLIDPPKIAGPDDRLERARDEHELYFRSHPKQTDREYLLAVFDQLANLPGTKDVFGEHNPIRELPNWLSGDAAGELLRFFQKIDANTGALVHDFTDANWDTRFLGDLYQDLSEAARKKYALLQTPEFIEEFILDRTLNPAIDEFGIDAAPVLDKDGKPVTEAGFRMIDPACGSGHFLLGAFPRILDRWQRKEPGTNVRELVQRTLDSIHGVDVNPYAVAIARFRLLLAAMRACRVTRLADAPGFRLNLACGDSLLHSPLKTGHRVFDFELTSGDAECEHAYQSEDLPVLKRILRGGQYHAVVANPPYITPKDRQLNERYRLRFQSCHRKYSLAVPFLERIFRLAVVGGYTGQITANSFMKREFGKKLIEEFLPRVDLTHVLDTSVVYVPGHTTSTVILLGRHRSPVQTVVRIAMGIRGESEAPLDPANAPVWKALTSQVDISDSQSAYFSVSDRDRSNFFKHPWSIGGGGAAELKEVLDERSAAELREFTNVIGYLGIPAADDILISDSSAFRRRSVEPEVHRPLVLGEDVREWLLHPSEGAIFPYRDSQLLHINQFPGLHRWMWPHRTLVGNRVTFGKKTYFEEGRPWWAWHQVSLDRLDSRPALMFGEVATHAHFALDDQCLIHKHSARLIKFPESTTKEVMVGLLGALNSSVVCFWLKQVVSCKGLGGQGGGIKPETWTRQFVFDAAKVGSSPLPESLPHDIAAQIISHGSAMREQEPDRILRYWSSASGSLLRIIESGMKQWQASLKMMVACQEELDWELYYQFGLTQRSLTLDRIIHGIQPGERAFEIVLARALEKGETETSWFTLHSIQPHTHISDGHDPRYQSLIIERIAEISENSNVRLIEQPDYKRRWNSEPWESQLERALREWLLDRLESYFDFDGRMNDAGQTTAKLDIALGSVVKLADVARQDAEFLQVGELYRDDPAFDVQTLVTELVAAEYVPLLPVLRYKPSGLIKRGTWERTWELQRQEDAIDARTKLPNTDPEYLTEDAARDLKQKQVGSISVPTKYDSKDFLDSNLWRLRGKLDVPKERWISFPHCEGPDSTPVIAWAGYDHLQQARAISAYYVRVQTEFGGTDDARLIPLLACLIELLPWLKQWHNDPDPAFDGMRMGDYFEGFVNEEARQLNKTLPEIKAWTPPARPSGRGRRKTT